MPPERYPPADHLQQVSLEAFQGAVAYGFPADYMTLLPVGFYPERFEVPASRSELRKKYDIDEDTFVILSIAAINRRHKRIDYLTTEVAKLEGDVMFWIDGSMDQGDPDLVEFVRDTLGARCRISRVATEEVGELLKLADLFVHGALSESFGLSIVEAASVGAPLMIHNDAHFQWLIRNSACWVDMSKEGALSSRVGELLRNRDESSTLVDADEAVARFSWHQLKPDYLALYEKLAQLPLS